MQPSLFDDRDSTPKSKASARPDPRFVGKYGLVTAPPIDPQTTTIDFRDDPASGVAFILIPDDPTEAVMDAVGRAIDARAAACNEMLRARFGRCLPEGREYFTWCRMTDAQRRVVNALADHRGRARAIHLDSLAIVAGFGHDTRSLQAESADLVLRLGCLISRSESCGMYIIETPEEAERSANHQWKRGISNLVQAAALRRLTRAQLRDLIDAEIGQLPLFNSAECGDGDRPHAPATTKMED